MHMTAISILKVAKFREIILITVAVVSFGSQTKPFVSQVVKSLTIMLLMAREAV